MIDYVIISSDDNPTYKDFYEVVSKKWLELGFKTYYINITDKDEIIENKYGIIHKIKKLDFVSESFQSQVVRLYSSNLINDKNILISDIDMLPLNGKYFSDFAEKLNKNNVLLYSGQPYETVPFYPMCYVLSNSNFLRSILEIENYNFHDFCKILVEKYGDVWNCDENFLYDKIQNNLEKTIISERDYGTRIDRTHFFYSEERLSEGLYVDSHLPKPYQLFENEINKLSNFKKITD